MHELNGGQEGVTFATGGCSLRLGRLGGAANLCTVGSRAEHHDHGQRTRENWDSEPQEEDLQCMDSRTTRIGWTFSWL